MHGERCGSGLRIAPARAAQPHRRRKLRLRAAAADRRPHRRRQRRRGRHRRRQRHDRRGHAHRLRADLAAGHAGRFFRVEAANTGELRSWQVGIAGITEITVYRNDGIAYTATSAGRAGTNPPRQAWVGDDAPGRTDINGKGPFGVRRAYRHDRFGLLRIDAVASDGLSATATALCAG